ncbi:hypothetical protein CPB83DRAFT_864005 [Crepidotus variabilis]|uniref:F-box domain-containing protein n=1 Tax=Crepidotus variabilis TaxID=179855 RepID=A0A9P6E5B6_9AGAR|nr:hypothetical protein CPB83DRAFT_864005 [Crepidotus variabilis]
MYWNCARIATEEHAPRAKKLTEIEHQIVHAQCALTKLLDEKERMASALNEHHDPLIRRFPPELASRIFLYTLPYQPSTAVFDSVFEEKTHIKAVFKLGHVCRHWRAVAHSTPELWTIFSATISPRNCVSLVQRSRDWLERSRGLPLLLQLRVSHPGNEMVSHAGQKVVASALLHSQRLMVLSLKVPTHWLNWMSEKLLSQSMDGLKHLTFGVADEISEEDILCLNASPRSLTLFQAWLNQIPMDWSQLSCVSAGTTSLTLGECTQIFRNAPRISFCHLHDITEDLDSITIVSNSSIRTLIIHTFPDIFWDHFSFPSLEILDVTNPQHEHDGSWVHLKDLIHRSGSNIKELRVDDGGNYQQAIVEVLEFTPDLEELVLRGKIHNNSFFSLIDDAVTSADVAGSIFLGKLRSLQCTTFCFDYGWSWLIVF